LATHYRSNWIMLFIGIAVGVLAMWAFTSLQGPALRGVTPYIIEGYSTGTNFEGTAIGVAKEPGGPGEGYIIAGARWREFGGPWNDRGTPPSLAQPNTGQKIRLGIVNVKPTQQAFGGPVVAWLEVLSQ
jgi:hypothetical protein